MDKLSLHVFLNGLTYLLKRDIELNTEGTMYFNFIEMFDSIVFEKESNGENMANANDCRCEWGV